MKVLGKLKKKIPMTSPGIDRAVVVNDAPLSPETISYLQ
jgi:hypothetical protein